MARPKGQPKLGGRKAGTPNKATADVRALAQQYGPKAMKVLHDIMIDGQSPASARVSAAKEVLERGYGKSPQPITANASNFAEIFGELIAAQPS